MGWFRRTPPRPGPPEEQLSTRSPSHEWTWWDDAGRKHQQRCTCDTGQDHTTPREGR